MNCDSDISSRGAGRTAAPARRRWLRRVAPALCALLAVGTLQASEEVLHSFGEIRDPYFGETLFQYYQEDVFMALSQSLVGFDANRLQDNKIQARQLLGELLLSYGLHKDAEKELIGLGKDNRTADVQDHAWLDLAASNYRRGLYSDAERALQHVGKNLSDEGEERRQALQGSLFMARRDYENAAEVFSRLKSNSDWGSYGAYNLGIALLNSGKFEQGVAELNKLGRRNFESEELRELKDQANLALGFLSLRAKDPGRATEYLERVRLRSAHSNRALLGIGWTHMMRRDYQSALVALLELYKRSPGDPAVLEAYLAVPYAYDQLKSTSQAVDYYEKAVAAFEDEIRQVDKAGSRFRSAGPLVSILAPSDGTWMSRIDNWPHSAESRLFVRLMADPWFNATVSNYKDLLILRDKLKNWGTVVDVYENMLTTRQRGTTQAATDAVTTDETDPRKSANFRHLKLQSQQVADINIAKIGDIKQRTTALKPSLDQAIREHEEYVQRLVLGELEREKQQLSRYLNRARFALAQLYDQVLRQESVGQ